MSFQSLNPELTAKVLFLANLQRNLVRFDSRNTDQSMRIIQMQNQNINNEKIVEPTTTIGQQLVHPLLMPSLVSISSKTT
jgi:hypothetical protein